MYKIYSIKKNNKPEAVLCVAERPWVNGTDWTNWQTSPMVDMASIAQYRLNQRKYIRFNEWFQWSVNYVKPAFFFICGGRISVRFGRFFFYLGDGPFLASMWCMCGRGGGLYCGLPYTCCPRIPMCWGNPVIWDNVTFSELRIKAEYYAYYDVRFYSLPFFFNHIMLW